MEDDREIADQAIMAAAVMDREPACREVLFRTLDFCRKPCPREDAERFARELMAGDAVLFDPSDLVDRLASCGALACEELLDGVRLTDDEAERFRMGEFERADEVEVRCSVTDVGREALAIMDPAARVRDLLSCAPERADLFCATLEFCAEPRSLDEVSALLEEDDRVATIHRSEGRVYPSYFLEKLKAAGALVWKGGWRSTEEGLRAVAAWRAAESAQR